MVRGVCCIGLKFKTHRVVSRHRFARPTGRRTDAERLAESWIDNEVEVAFVTMTQRTTAQVARKGQSNNLKADQSCIQSNIKAN